MGFRKTVFDYCEGKITLEDIRALSEEKVDKNAVKDFEKSTYFKAICKRAQSMLTRAEATGRRDGGERDDGTIERDFIDEYREYWEKNTIKAIKQEITDFAFIVEQFSQISMTNYKSADMLAVGKLIDSALRSIKMATNKINRCHNNEDAIQEFSTSGTGCGYLLVKGLNFGKDVCKILGVDWVYDIDWQSYLNKTKPQKRKDVAVDDKGNRVVDYGVPESIQKRIKYFLRLLNKVDSQTAEKLQEDFGKSLHPHYAEYYKECLEQRGAKDEH